MNRLFITVEEVANILDVSKSKAYKIVLSMNKDMKDKGYLIILGRVNRDYFNDHIYFSKNRRED